MDCIKGQVMKEGSLIPLSSCSVYCLEIELGTYTNDEGRFTLCDGRLDSSSVFTVIISHIGFTSDTILLSRQKENNIHLVPTDYALRDVVVTPLTVKEIVERIKKNIRKNHKLETSFCFDSYYKHFYSKSNLLFEMVANNKVKINGRLDYEVTKVRTKYITSNQLDKKSLNEERPLIPYHFSFPYLFRNYRDKDFRIWSNKADDVSLQSLNYWENELCYVLAKGRDTFYVNVEDYAIMALSNKNEKTYFRKIGNKYLPIYYFIQNDNSNTTIFFNYLDEKCDDRIFNTPILGVATYEDLKLDSLNISWDDSFWGNLPFITLESKFLR